MSAVRNASGFQDSDDASDTQVQEAIDDAMAYFLTDGPARWLQGQALEGAVDGSNKDYELPAPWRLVADDTMDETVGASDVYVYQEDRSEDPPTRSELTVSSVDSRYGVITLQSAPSSDSGSHILYDGYVLKEVWDMQVVRRAVKALASWYLHGTVRDGSQVLLADPERSEGGDREPSGVRHLRDYKRAVKALSGGSSFSVASRDKSMPGRGGVL